jgi:alkylation response protein AidB-like acyl-CoA dehydrogenase
VDLELSESYLAFQEEVENFLASNWRSDLSKDPEAVGVFRHTATGAGYLYRNVPEIYGGSGQSPDVLKAKIIGECFARARAPREVSGVGMMMLVPTLLDCGSEVQKRTFIPETLAGKYRWAQGYSEPGAGSDLASLRTKGELVDGHWLINGQKIWTTMAHKCTHMFALVRTEPLAGKHAGISYLLLELDQPGVTVKPLKQMNGGKEFCEVFFEDALTPADWIVGERGEGWQVSKSTLKHERNAVGAAGAAKEMFDKLVQQARDSTVNGLPAIQDPLIRDRLAKIQGRVMAHLCAGYYQLSCDAKGADAGIVGLMNKMNTTLIGHEIASTVSEVIGDSNLQMPNYQAGRPGEEKWVNQQMLSLAAALGGGTSNINLNIIAERGLGLPRD